MIALANQMFESVDAEIYRVVDCTPPKELANVVQFEARYLKALRYREQKPSSECRAAFGFAYPSVSAVWAHYVERMRQGDLFDHDTQRQMHRDIGRARR